MCCDIAKLSMRLFAHVFFLVICLFNLRTEAKVFERCELAKLLHFRHGLGLDEVSKWVCIAQHTSSFNTEAYASGLEGGSHGLFQISDVYWCSPPGKGFGCNVPCSRLRDADLTDDLACARIIHAEHQRLSGDGYNAWQAYPQFCRFSTHSYIAGCFAPTATNLPNFLQVATAFKSQQQATFAQNTVSVPQKRAKIYNRCELAQELYYKHKLPMEQIPTWVCIAQHESNFDTSAVGRLNADGSADHGLFQISDLFWCSKQQHGGGKACGLHCNKLLDNDITDDVRCIRRIHSEHTGISGDGFTAWTVYNPYCRNQRYEQVSSCFRAQPPNYAKDKTHGFSQIQHAPANPFFDNFLGASSQAFGQYSPQPHLNNFIHHTAKPPPQKGKIYNRCELANELYFKHKFPMQDIATWVCIAQHESNYNTAAVGRLNGDGSEDHGLFQISDLYWCAHDDERGGKACGLPCNKLLDADLTDDVQCIRTIHAEHTRISGDGYTAWAVYNPHCRNQQLTQIASCFDSKEVEKASAQGHTDVEPNYKPGKRKVYNKCELAQELYFKQKLPMKDIPTWVCIAQHESSYDTSAVGRLNADGSADHGLFQISDLYWCSHDRHGGKACNIPCSKLIDDDITDDVRCIKTIHAEHTRISGDGFTAWTVYNPHCRNQQLSQIAACFDAKELEKGIQTVSDTSVTAIAPSYKPGKRKVYKKCELAQELYFKHKLHMKDIATWVCIAQHESSYDTSAIGRLNTDGSADHGLFQISDLYWCSHDNYGGKACNIPCSKLIDNDITDDVRCIRTIHEEHTRISGDGFTAWAVYNPHCRNQQLSQVATCFDAKEIERGTQAQPSSVNSVAVPNYKPAKRRVYKKCELAQELYFKHKLPLKDIATWVCIAQHESSYDTSAIGRLNSDGSADHGLFQISDLYWCSHDNYGGKACNIPCSKLIDDDITDDIRCIKTIHAEHTRISGDGFTAWTVYKPHCRNQQLSQLAACFDDNVIAKAQKESTTQPSTNIAPSKRKVYNKCELAQELYHKHKLPIEEIPTWVCIAQHESSFDTSAVGRLNTDGSADHGLFQISDIYWCTHDSYGGKACNLPCSKLIDDDLTDDIRCIRTIHEEHTRISGDGFNAWTVYKPHCRNQQVQHIAECFDGKVIGKAQKQTPVQNSLPSYKPSSRKVYQKCELAQELYFKHKLAMKDIPTWVCIAQYESSFDTSAVGRLNSDGSGDHGLFQISDLYWCSHDTHGGKACNIPCDKLLDGDLSDDVRCIKIIHEEHTRISGDGFNAWTVYKPHCRNQQLEHIKACFDSKVLANSLSGSNAQNNNQKQATLSNKYASNPFLNSGVPKTGKPEVQKQVNQYASNPFLNRNSVAPTQIQTTKSTAKSSEQSPKQKYQHNPFLNGQIPTTATLKLQSVQPVITVEHYKQNPFLQNHYKAHTTKKTTPQAALNTSSKKVIAPTQSASTLPTALPSRPLQPPKNYVQSESIRTTASTGKIPIASPKKPVTTSQQHTIPYQHSTTTTKKPQTTTTYISTTKLSTTTSKPTLPKTTTTYNWLTTSKTTVRSTTSAIPIKTLTTLRPTTTRTTQPTAIKFSTLKLSPTPPAFITTTTKSWQTPTTKKSTTAFNQTTNRLIYSKTTPATTYKQPTTTTKKSTSSIIAAKTTSSINTKTTTTTTSKNVSSQVPSKLTTKPTSTQTQKPTSTTTTTKLTTSTTRKPTTTQTTKKISTTKSTATAAITTTKVTTSTTRAETRKSTTTQPTKKISTIKLETVRTMPTTTKKTSSVAITTKSTPPTSTTKKTTISTRKPTTTQPIQKLYTTKSTETARATPTTTKKTTTPTTTTKKTTTPITTKKTTTPTTTKKTTTPPTTKKTTTPITIRASTKKPTTAQLTKTTTTTRKIPTTARTTPTTTTRPTITTTKSNIYIKSTSPTTWKPITQQTTKTTTRKSSTKLQQVTPTTTSSKTSANNKSSTTATSYTVSNRTITTTTTTKKPTTTWNWLNTRNTTAITTKKTTTISTKTVPVSKSGSYAVTNPPTNTIPTTTKYPIYEAGNKNKVGYNITRPDPFSHPFFDKYKDKFSFFTTTTPKPKYYNTTPPYFELFQSTNRSIYAYSFGQNIPFKNYLKNDSILKPENKTVT